MANLNKIVRVSFTEEQHDDLMIIAKRQGISVSVAVKSMAHEWMRNYGGTPDRHKALEEMKVAGNA